MIIKRGGDGGGLLLLFSAKGLFRHWLPLGTNSLGGSGHEGRNPCHPVKFIRLKKKIIIKKRDPVVRRTADKTCQLSFVTPVSCMYLCVSPSLALSLSLLPNNYFIDAKSQIQL